MMNQNPKMVEKLYIEETVNKFGTPISVFRCYSCGDMFTICPAVQISQRKIYINDGCGNGDCDSYDPSRDVGVLFGDYSMLNLFCKRKGIDPQTLLASLLKGIVYRGA